MQNSTEAVLKGGIVVAYKVAPGPGPSPVAILQVFYDV